MCLFGQSIWMTEREQICCLFGQPAQRFVYLFVYMTEKLIDDRKVADFMLFCLAMQ